MDFLDNTWDWDYDPYPIDDGRDDSLNNKNNSNEPVGHDDWADEDINGGF